MCIVEKTVYAITPCKTATVRYVATRLLIIFCSVFLLFFFSHIFPEKYVRCLNGIRARADIGFFVSSLRFGRTGARNALEFGFYSICLQRDSRTRLCRSFYVCVAINESNWVYAQRKQHDDARYRCLICVNSKRSMD